MTICIRKTTWPVACMALAIMICLARARRWVPVGAQPTVT